MLKPRTIALSIFAIWGVIVIIFYMRESGQATRTLTTVTVGDGTIKEQQYRKVETTPTTKDVHTQQEDIDIVKEEPEFRGEIKFGEKMCLDTLEHKSGNVGLWECHGEGRNQHWHITKDHLLKNDDVCIQAAGENENGNLATLEKCNENVKEQKWTHKDGLLNLIGTKRCIDGEDRNGLKVINCDRNSVRQKFKLFSSRKELGA